MELRNTIAIVTGGARGIGRGIALALARQGVHVAVADLYTPSQGTAGYALSAAQEVNTTVWELTALGVRAIGVSVDVTQWGQVQEMVETVTQQLGPIDIVCNNAVCPGIVGTAMWLDHLIERRVEEMGDDRQATFAQYTSSLTPLGRPQTPEDIGEAVVYLARADNVTGIALNVAGGLVMH
jgi:NAD(P)-dependent dehydrogenase (short-subunit alcohol dehydrogenase family)